MSEIETLNLALKVESERYEKLNLDNQDLQSRYDSLLIEFENLRDENSQLKKDLDKYGKPKSLADSRAEAIRIILASEDPLPLGVRGICRDLYTKINDILEHIGQPREDEENVIIPRLLAGIAGGLGDSPKK